MQTGSISNIHPPVSVGQAHSSAHLQCRQADFRQSRGLKESSVLGKDRPHGDRLRYLAGCKCALCKKANSEYANSRARAIKAGEGNGLVSPEKAQTHLKALSEAGVGRRTVSDITGVSIVILFEIIHGTRKNIRALTERKILAVTKDCLADRALIPAGPTWELLNKLLADGYTKAELAKEMGYKVPALQINRKSVTVRNAATVKKLYDKLHKCSARASLALLGELRDEGYRQAVIESEIQAMATSLHMSNPSIEVTNGRIQAQAARLIELVHTKLMQ